MDSSALQHFLGSFLIWIDTLKMHQFLGSLLILMAWYINICGSSFTFSNGVMCPILLSMLASMYQDLPSSNTSFRNIKDFELLRSVLFMYLMAQHASIMFWGYISLMDSVFVALLILGYFGDSGTGRVNHQSSGIPLPQPPAPPRTIYRWYATDDDDATEKTPTDKTPTDKTLTEKTPTEKTPTDKTPTGRGEEQSLILTPHPPPRTIYRWYATDDDDDDATEKTPTDKTPTDKTPTGKTPTEKMPTDKTPTGRGEEQSLILTPHPPPRTIYRWYATDDDDDDATEKTATDKTPTDKTPTEKTPTDKTPTGRGEEQSLILTPHPPPRTIYRWYATDDDATEKTPTDKTATDKTPTEKTPTEKTPMDKTPTGRGEKQSLILTPHPPPRTIYRWYATDDDDATEKTPSV
jgi:hypothetical protein